MRALMVEFLVRGANLDQLGFLPEILDASDKRPVAEQLDERYAHGGGYRPSKAKWKLIDRVDFNLHYPGDPVYRPSHKFIFPHSKEIAFFYPEGSFLLIVQEDGLGDYVITRVD